MKIPLTYNWRSLAGRPVSTLFTALGIGMVVAVFIAMLALANGFARALASTGSDENVIVLRKGADNELSSAIDRATVSILAASPHVAHAADGTPLVSPEAYIVLPRGRIEDTTKNANVVLRGISPAVWEVRTNLRILPGGRAPEPAKDEVCVGRKLVAGFPHTAVGDVMDIGGRPWTVVCHFSADGSSFESEIWGPNEQVLSVLRRTAFQSVTFRLADPAAFEDAKRALEGDLRLTVGVERESAFYAKQSELLGKVLKVLAILITSIMAVGAVFGAINTMFAAVASRASEIAVLLTLGFRPRSILASFLAESMLLALVGGIIGCLIALPVNGVVANTTNWASFSEIAFGFRVTPALLLAGLVFSLVMGLVGGLLPAWRAARMSVVKAIR
jgi:ABC-type lipoprotein release transport system permease subunit